VLCSTKKTLSAISISLNYTGNVSWKPSMAQRCIKWAASKSGCKLAFH